jgi:5'-3' exonuclease
MGIFHFFGWFKNNFSGNIKKLSATQNFKSIELPIDNLMIDMNGLFHNSAQKVFQYGNFKPVERLLKNNKKIIHGRREELKVFEDICKTIDNLLIVVNPQKRLILCVDGPAPYAKQVQQKRRRFRSAMEREEDDNSFDSNCISPGTKFMDNLSKYIDWYIRKSVSENPLWQNIEIIFSNEKVPGEGEHLILSYVRQYGDINESYCLHGEDADLIMLSLGTHYPNFYILRNDTYDENNKYFVINIANTALQLGEMMRWESEKYEYNPPNAIDDFIFLCFMIGNDFLPHISSLEIIESGIDIILSLYREVCKSKGHIIKIKDDNIYFNKEPLKMFFELVSDYEKQLLEKKLLNRRFYYEDELLESCAIIEKDKINLDIDKYRSEYCKKYFEKENIKEVCHSYLEGLEWVISYYKKGVPNWTWYYQYDYAPPANIIAEHISTFKFPKYKKTIPLLPFQQLLSIMPPKSSNLLPQPLNKLLIEDDSEMKQYCPEDFEIDLAGKKNDWQGIVRLPIINPEKVIQIYNTKVKLIDEREMRRNIFGKSFIYIYNNSCNTTFNSYYGIIYNCKVQNKVINL